MENRATAANARENGHPANPFVAAPVTGPFDGDDPSWAIAAKQPVDFPQQTHEANLPAAYRHGRSLDTFLPLAPANLERAGLRERQVEALVLKYLLNCSAASGRAIAKQIALPFGLLSGLLAQMKLEALVGIRSDAPVNDFIYELTLAGAERARSYALQSTYFGAAPVPLEAYIASVEAQSVSNQRPGVETIAKAFGDLILDEDMLYQIGEGINLARGFFIHGQPGNGKTSIAERVTRCYSETIWIPRAISAGGEIIRLFDSTVHEELSTETLVQGETPVELDARWIRIRRPTISVGGELTMDRLEVTTNPVTGISEAPIQLKSNCGTLIVDDFGRHAFSPSDLLNRLIVPLEMRVDCLNLPSGRSFRVPFDPVIIFATNLRPADMVDEAFLRRISYTLEVFDPSEEQFRRLLAENSRNQGLEFATELVDYLMENYYRSTGHPRRFCHPRDLVRHIRNACEFRKLPLVATKELIDSATQRCLTLRAQVAACTG